MAGPVILSTGLIENRAPSAGSERPVTSLVIKVENNEVTSSTTEGVPIVLLEAFTATPTGAGFGTQETYVLYQVSLTDVNQPNSTFTIDNVFANLDNFGVRCTVTSTGSTLNFLPTVTVFGNNTQNNMVASYGLSRVSTSPADHLLVFGMKTRVIPFTFLQRMLIIRRFVMMLLVLLRTARSHSIKCGMTTKALAELPMLLLQTVSIGPFRPTLQVLSARHVTHVYYMIQTDSVSVNLIASGTGIPLLLTSVLVYRRQTFA